MLSDQPSRLLNRSLPFGYPHLHPAVSHPAPLPAFSRHLQPFPIFYNINRNTRILLNKRTPLQNSLRWCNGSIQACLVCDLVFNSEPGRQNYISFSEFHLATSYIVKGVCPIRKPVGFFASSFPSFLVCPKAAQNSRNHALHPRPPVPFPAISWLLHLLSSTLSANSLQLPCSHLYR